MTEQREIDNVTGTETTGHEWDGIKELNTPLPRWWLYVLYASIVWSIGYWILMPAWPTFWGYTGGALGHSDRARVAAAIVEAQAAQSQFRDRIAAASLEEIRGDAELMEFALAGGTAAFGDNCAGCHGSGAQGFPGYPNLNDDDWIWGGTLEEIHTTLLVGIRATHEDTRDNAMPAFRRDEILTAAEISDTAEYVLSLSGQDHAADAAARGLTAFAENCASCHGEEGSGITELGAPNLTDAIWLYGGEKGKIVESISNSRAGVMPSWQGRLDEVTLKQLALRVHALGGGQ